MQTLKEVHVRTGLALAASIGFCFLYPLSFSTTGLFLVELGSHYGQSHKAITWIAAFQSGLGGGFGIFTGCALKRFGTKAVAMASTSLAVLGLLTGPLVDDLYYLYASYGLIFGVGSTGFVIVGYTRALQVFPDHKPLVSGILASAISVGGFVWAPTTELLISKYTWKGALIILAGVHLHGFLFSLLLTCLPKSYTEEEVNDSSSNYAKKNYKDYSLTKEGTKVNFTSTGHLKGIRSLGQDEEPDIQIKDQLLNHTTSQITQDQEHDESIEAAKRDGLTKPYQVGSSRRWCCHNGELDWRVGGVLMMLASPLESACHMNFYTYIPTLADQSHFTRRQGAMLLATINICSAVCRMPSGLIGNLKGVNCTLLYGCSLLIAATLSMSSMMFSGGYIALALLCGGYGVFAGCYMSLLCPATLEHIPSRHMEVALGLQCSMDGIFIFLLHSSAGYILDILGDSNSLFFIFGGCGLMGSCFALMLFFTKYILSKTKKRASLNTSQTKSSC